MISVVDTLTISCYPTLSEVEWRTIECSVHGEVIKKKGRLGSLKVIRYSDGRVRVSGSLPKFWRGDNVRALTFPEHVAALQQVREAFGCNPDHVSVHRLDMAATMALPRPAVQYLDVLGETSYFVRHCYPASVQYVNGLRTRSFYDKGKKDGLTKKNWLRFEVQYKKDVQRRFGHAVTLAHLLGPAFYRRLVEKWTEEFDAVGKMGQPILKPTRYPSKLRKQLAHAGIAQFGGEGDVLRHIDSWDYDANTRYRLRKEVRNRAAESIDRDDMQRIQELEEAVQRKARMLLETVPS